VFGLVGAWRMRLYLIGALEGGFEHLNPDGIAPKHPKGLEG
jgi:hypothetical protein